MFSVASSRVAYFGLQSVIVVFPCHTLLIFDCVLKGKYNALKLHMFSQGHSWYQQHVLLHDKIHFALILLVYT